MTERSQRIISIDILRGITILVMIFVNDIAGVSGTPAWMKHISPPLADGMTFVDWVFPSFLFIVGMAIPFAIGSRVNKGESQYQIIRHILLRTASLLIIGVFMVNGKSLSDQGILLPALWTLLTYLGVILVWNTDPKKESKKFSLYKNLKLTGIVILIAMVFLYRGSGEPGFIEMRPQWWGILGLIGWAYLVASIIYIIFRKNIAALTGTVALLYLIYFADATNFFSGFYDIFPWINIGSMLGSHAAISLSGVVLGMILLPDSDIQRPNSRMRWAALYGIGLYLAGYLLHTLHDIDQMFIINKILATPAWCLISSAYTVWLWVIIYYLIDVKKWDKWALIIKPAGANALFAYILAPILYAVFSLMALVINNFNPYYWLGNSFATGFWRSVIFAFAVTWIAGGLRRFGIVLKL